MYTIICLFYILKIVSHFSINITNLYYPWSLNWTWTHQKLVKLWNWVRNMKLMNICHLMCFKYNKQGKMLSLKDFTALANQKLVVLLIPVSSPLCIVTIFSWDCSFGGNATHQRSLITWTAHKIQNRVDRLLSKMSSPSLICKFYRGWILPKF